jgi:MFS family permease
MAENRDQTNSSRFEVLKILTNDGRFLFMTRIVRLFAYGFLSVILVLYLAELGLKETEIGLLLTLVLIGDTLISLWITTNADRIGRRRMLIIGAVLMIFAGVFFALTRNFIILLIAATIGVISPSGYEVGPFLSIEQAALSQIVADDRRTQVFAWYNLFGSFTTAIGSLCGGTLVEVLEQMGISPLESYRMVVVVYAAIGMVLAFLFSRLSSAVEASPVRNPISFQSDRKRLLGLHKSRRVVFKLSAFFSLDAFAGGFVLQSILAYWFHVRFNAQPGLLGSIFFGANVLAGISALAAAKVAKRIGLVNTMVFTHIPSNILLILVPFMPNLSLAITVLLMRFSISQMDVPTRQSYTMAVVSSDERSAAAGITGIARTTGSSVSPVVTGPLLANPALLSFPFVIAGGLKIIYDLLLYRSFKAIKPPEEKKRT